MEWIHELIEWLVEFTDRLGYGGLLIMTFLEATIFPLPAEATMIPVGYLVEQGEMGLVRSLIISTIGTVGGSYFNYWLAQKYGRGMFIRYGRYFLMDEAKLARFEHFFANHGAISTFTGRVMPGLRHYISLPAGLANMDLKKFLFYSGLGGFVCSAMLIMIGWFIGANQAVAKHYLPLIKLAILFTLLAGIGIYIWRHYWKKKNGARKR